MYGVTVVTTKSVFVRFAKLGGQAVPGAREGHG